MISHHAMQCGTRALHVAVIAFTVVFAVAQTAGYQLCLGKGASYIDAKTIEVSQPVSQFRRKLCRQFWASMILISRSGAGQSIVGGVALAPFISEEIGAISGPVFEEGRIGFVRAYQFDIVALCEHFGRPGLGGRAPLQIGLQRSGIRLSNGQTRSAFSPCSSWPRRTLKSQSSKDRPLQ